MRLREKLQSSKVQKFSALHQLPHNGMRNHRDDDPNLEETSIAAAVDRKNSSTTMPFPTFLLSNNNNKLDNNRKKHNNSLHSKQNEFKSSAATRAMILERIRRLQPLHTSPSRSVASSTENKVPKTTMMMMNKKGDHEELIHNHSWQSKTSFEDTPMMMNTDPTFNPTRTTMSLKNAWTVKVMEEAHDIEQQIGMLKEKKKHMLLISRPQQTQDSKWNDGKSNTEMAKQIIAKRISERNVMRYDTRSKVHDKIDGFYNRQDENHRPSRRHSSVYNHMDVKDVLWNNGRGVRLCNMDSFGQSQEDHDDNSLQSSVHLNPISSLDRIKQKFEYDYEDRYCYSNELCSHDSYYNDYSISSCSDEWNHDKSMTHFKDRSTDDGSRSIRYYSTE